MSDELVKLWVYLAADPLLWLTLTLVAYQGGLWLHRRYGGNPLLNPVLIAVLLLVGVVLGTGVQYRDYFAGAQFVHFLLGPATVALAVPLFRQLASVRRALPALLGALVAGSLTAAGSAVLIGWALGADRQTLLSLAPKSATTPIAMGVAEQIGGLPSLTAVLVILTGIVGAVIATATLNLIGVKDWRARGFAVGTVAHGIGTARAFQVHPIAGAYAGLAMGFNGLLTAVVLPALVSAMG
jgi:predicted murein hydrolase (TIGR00659 family)